MISLELIVSTSPVNAELTLETLSPVFELTIEQVLLPLYSPVVNINDETPAGLMDGSNATFVTAHAFVPETLKVYLNGMRIRLLADYTTSGDRTILLYNSPSAGENLLVNYQTPI